MLVVSLKSYDVFEDTKHVPIHKSIPPAKYLH